MQTHSLLSCLFVLSFVFVGSLRADEWYRGNLHMHTFWSDGNVFPEQAADWYKENGYHFVSLTEHGQLQENAQRWIPIEPDARGFPRWSEGVLEKYIEKYGTPDTREVEGKKQVRLHTIHELKKKLDIPGRFLLIPGFEGNSGVSARSGGYVCEGNALNVATTIRFPRLAPNVENLTEILDETALAVRKNGEDHGQITELMVNHPLWPYFDIDPLSLANAKEVRLHEFLNGGPVGMYAQPDIVNRYWNRESFWDIVNTFRSIKGYPLVYGVAADDTHYYLDTDRSRSLLESGWIVVRAKNLDANEIMLALRNGDFYMSCGVEMEDIRFDKETGTLSVKVKPEIDVKYRIQFVGTKRDFDQTYTVFEIEQTERYPARKGWTFSKDIGIELLSVEGTEASYQLKEDDLYVRAIITSNKRRVFRDPWGPETVTAWTQPYQPVHPFENRSNHFNP